MNKQRARQTAKLATPLLLAAAMTAVLVPAVFAEDVFESDELFRKGSWHVELTNNTTSGSFWCSAETDNNYNQTFSLTGYSDGSFAIFVFDPSWNIAERDVRFLVDIDHSSWVFDGSGDGISVSISPDVDKKLTTFIRQLMQGNNIVVMNASRRRLARFSLNGSYAAISNFLDCWSNIGRLSDPFTNANDPFT